MDSTLRTKYAGRELTVSYKIRKQKQYKYKLKALVLSGGAVKGSFQAGAIQAVIESGFIPDVIYGTSVGSLNGAFIVNAAGKKYREKGQPLDKGDWHEFVVQLTQFWHTQITKPEDIILRRSFLGDALQIIFKKFHGFYDTAPINKKIDEQLDVPNMAASPVGLHVGAVDFLSGNLIYKTPHDPDFITYLKGSISIPIAMPPSVSGKDEVLFDGGTRDVAPLGRAINDGADTIVGTLCQAENLKAVQEGKGFRDGSLMNVVERLEDIIVNQNIQNDSQWINFLNELITEAAYKGYTLQNLSGYKLIRHLLIQPAVDLGIDMTNFTTQDIRDGIQSGYKAAKAILDNNQSKQIFTT